MDMAACTAALYAFSAEQRKLGTRQLIGHGCCDAILHNSVDALKRSLSFRLKVRFRRFRVRVSVRL